MRAGGGAPSRQHAMEYTVAVDQPWANPFPPASAWGAIVVLALVCSAYAYVLYFKLVASVGPTRAISVEFAVTAVAVVVGAVLLDERLTLVQIAGTGFIALGCALVLGLVPGFRRTASL